MFALPLAGSAACEMFDVADLVDVGAGRKLPLMMIEARSAARRFFAESDPAVRRVCYFVLLADDRLALVSYGRRLRPKREWVFGPYKAPRQ